MRFAKQIAAAGDDRPDQACVLPTTERQARAAAAASLRPHSGPMRAVQRLWEALKPAQLKPLFETADVEGSGNAELAAAAEQGDGRAAKRQRA